jgi:hypothetical protein
MAILQNFSGLIVFSTSNQAPLEGRNSSGNCGVHIGTILLALKLRTSSGTSLLIAYFPWMRLTILSSLFKMDGYCPSEHGGQLKRRKDELHQVAELAGLGMKLALAYEAAMRTSMTSFQVSFVSREE